MPQDIRSKEKEVDPVSHFNKNPSVVTLKKKRPNLKENVISERSGAAQSSHHPYSPSPNKPLPFSRYHKRTSTCSVAANDSNPFPTLLCLPRPPDLYCSLLLSEHLPTNKKRAKSTATVERGEQHTGGQESRFTAVSSAASSFQAAGLFQGSAEKHVVCFMRQTRPQTQPNINECWFVFGCLINLTYTRYINRPVAKKN